MRCTNCGAVVADGVAYCTNCGASLQSQQFQQNCNAGMSQSAYGFNPQMQQNPQFQQYGASPQQAANMQDVGVGLKILSFLIPIVGIIFYFVKKNEQPIGAKSCLTWGLIGFAISVVGSIFV